MPLRYQPQEQSVRIAGKALSMKISVQAIRDLLQEEAAECRRRLGRVLENAEDVTLDFVDDESISDDQLTHALDIQGVQQDAARAMDAGYASRERGLLSMQSDIDGQIFSGINVRQLFEDGSVIKDRRAALSKMIDVTASQAAELLGFDPYTDAGFIAEAIRIMHDELGVPK